MGSIYTAFFYYKGMREDSENGEWNTKSKIACIFPKIRWIQNH